MPKGNRRASETNRAAADKYAIQIYDKHIQPLRMLGMTYEDIAEDLNRRKIPTAYRGGRWRTSRISEIVKRVRKLRSDDDDPSSRKRPREKIVRLPQSLIDKANAGDQEALIRLREKLGIRQEVWRALKRTISAISIAEEAPPLDFAAQSRTERMLIDCVKAQMVRMAGDAGTALSTLDNWLASEGNNPIARPDLQRRRSLALLSLGQIDEALATAQESVELNHRLGWAGFDLYDSPIGASLLAMGQVYGLSGRHSEAVSTFRNALTEVDFLVASELHGHIIGALAIDLAAIGSDDTLAEARGDLRIVRSRFFRKGAARSGYHMARLDWLEGSIAWRTAKRNPHRARDMVMRGRDLLTELQLPLDAACCAADLELMWKPEHRGEAIKDLAAWREKAKAILPAELDAGFETIANALDRPSFSKWDKSFLSIVRQVRKAFGKLGSVLPSFVSEPRKVN